MKIQLDRWNKNVMANNVMKKILLKIQSPRPLKKSKDNKKMRNLKNNVMVNSAVKRIIGLIPSKTSILLVKSIDYLRNRTQDKLITKQSENGEEISKPTENWLS